MGQLGLLAHQFCPARLQHSPLISVRLGLPGQLPSSGCRGPQHHVRFLVVQKSTGSSNSLAPPTSLRFQAFSTDDRTRRACMGDAPAPSAPEDTLTCRLMPRRFDFLSEREKFGADCLSRAHCMVEIRGHHEHRSPLILKVQD